MPTALDLLLAGELPKPHTSGRREDRLALYQRGFTIHAKPRTPEDAVKAQTTGEMIGTLPIRRAEPKRPAGMTARQWKKARREARTANIAASAQLAPPA